ncbi:MAG: HlyD family efflux transporter periplasmic adaptor subunit [Phycisphaerales bacterium]|nr:MAG: HlyD family efflux transporter periplasmic adaptor subunit [Phycisphaerales bacterium]
MARNNKRQVENGKGGQDGRTRAGRGKRFWVIGSLLLIVAAASVLLGWMRMPAAADADKAMSTFTVRTDDLTITVTESGSIKAQESTDVMCEVEGRGVEIANIVPEGTVITPEDVAQGKILCELNASDLQDYYNRELIDFSSAKASYLEAQEAHLIQKKQNESDIATAQLAVEFGLMDLQNYLGKTASTKLMDQVKLDPNTQIDAAALLDFLDNPTGEGGGAKQKLKELNDTIILAEERLTQAQSELASTKKLFQANYAPEIEVRQKELSVNSYKIQHEQASDALDLYKRYDFPKQTKQLLSDYFEAERELERTFARTRSRLAQTQAKLESTEARFNLQREHVSKLERQIAACTIRATSPGIIIYGTSADWHSRREDPIEVGDMVRKGQKIFTIPNSNVMGVELRVHESSVNKVLPGQYTTITVEALPDMLFHGTVLKVAPLPDPQHSWFDPGVKVYTTQVTIDGTHEVLKPGMSAKVEILVEQLYDVKIVPLQVVANRAGKKVCYVATERGPEEREVQTGAFNNTFVEIAGGLEVGENVLLSPPRMVGSTVASESKDPSRVPGQEKKLPSNDEDGTATVERPAAEEPSVPTSQTP